MPLISYSAANKEQWDAFIRGSKNGSFLFLRDYMEYHSARFSDSSLLAIEEGKLVAVLPANRVESTLTSHGGLTFGGFVTDSEMSAAKMLEIFEQLLDHCRRERIEKVIYKPVPHIYHRLPAEEDLYALFRNRATITKRALSTTISRDERLQMGSRRKRGVKKAKAAGVEVARSNGFREFMKISEDNLGRKYNLKPVHTADEIELLAGRFPENIKLFAATLSGRIVSGIIVYETAQVAHAQYIAATEEAQEVGGNDLVVTYLVEEEFRNKPYFDFGISTSHDGTELNRSLLENKEEFGGRAIVYDTYELAVS